MSPRQAPLAPPARKALAGFFVSGLLLATPGVVLPAWGYHLRNHFVAIGNYLLFLNAGLLLAVQVSRYLMARRGLTFLLTTGCALAFAAFVIFSLASPPTPEWWRLPGFLLVGVSAGLLNTGVFHAISGEYRARPAATITIAGCIFGLGSFVAVLLVALAYTVYTPPSLLILVGALPGLFALWFARRQFEPGPAIFERTPRELLQEVTTPSAILFSALLFFHFGNEWSIAGWLPLFLIERLGISPTAAMLLLAVYWLALVIGRLLTQLALGFVSHGKLLLGSVLASIFGCLFLAFTDNRFGAGCASVLLGLGFAPIYPLVVEKIGVRFPHYHPGFFNGVFSLALTGGMLVPATLGYAAEFFGLGVVVVWLITGTAIVLGLVIVLWIESKLSGKLSS